MTVMGRCKCTCMHELCFLGGDKRLLCKGGWSVFCSNSAGQDFHWLLTCSLQYYCTYCQVYVNSWIIFTDPYSDSVESSKFPFSKISSSHATNICGPDPWSCKKNKKSKNLAEMNNQYIMINIQNWSPWQQPLPSQAEN